MTIVAVRELAGRHLASASGVAALIAALDAKASGVPMAPAMAVRVQEVLVVLGAAELVDAMSPEEAARLVPELRQHLLIDQMLLRAESRATSWSPTSSDLLQDVGMFSRSHADVITQKLVPELAELADRLRRPGAAFLDVGVGVAGTSIRMCELWPELSVVGLDVWRPSLALARDNVQQAGLAQRITLREQPCETLEDERAFDLVWLPTVFMNDKIVPEAVRRVERALRPGGWLIFTYIAVDGLEPLSAALWRLRLTLFGGTDWPASRIEHELGAVGLTDVRVLPKHPAVPAGFAVARRRSD